MARVRRTNSNILKKATCNIEYLIHANEIRCLGFLPKNFSSSDANCTFFPLSFFLFTQTRKNSRLCSNLNTTAGEMKTQH